MTTITQNGFRFIYRNKRKGQLPIVETWDIERVAAFMALVEFYRIRSQRYVGHFTFVAAVGNIQYELEDFDTATYRDIDKLTRIFVEYTRDDICVMWYTAFDKALNMAEKLLKERVSREESPTEVFGRKVEAKRFYSRPTKEEYEAMEAAEHEKMKLPEGSTGKTIKVWFQAFGHIPCRIVKETASFIWVDGYVDGKIVVSGSRIKKGTSRIVSEGETV